MNDNNRMKLWWADSWQRLKNEPYAWTGADWAATKRLLSYGLTWQEITDRARRYFDNPSWAKFGNHSFPAFVKNINNVGPKLAGETSKRFYRCPCGFRGTYSEMQTHSEYCQALPVAEATAAQIATTPEAIRHQIDEALRT